MYQAEVEIMMSGSLLTLVDRLNEFYKILYYEGSELINTQIIDERELLDRFTAIITYRLDATI